MNNESKVIHPTNEKRTLKSDARNTWEAIKHDPSKAVVSLGAAAFIATGIALAPKIVDALDTQNSDSERYAEYHETDITQLVLEDGANLRNDPLVRQGEQNNLIDSLDLDNDAATLVINSPDGIYVKENTVNGDWYGVPATDIANIESVSDDKDGIIWINDDRAYPVNPPVDN